MISIFAKKTTRGRGGHLQRVSSMIRGVQVAEKIGAKLNPTKGYQKDVCVYVKPNVPKGYDFEFEGRRSYLDIIDGHNLGPLLFRHPEVGLIVCSDADFNVMSEVVNEKGEKLKNEILVIPQQNCNFERVTRARTEITKVGAIGTPGAFPFYPEGLAKSLEDRGMEFIQYSGFRTRQDVIDFYMGIDIQVVWRPYKKRLSNPLKLVNAASVGVPTIALDEKAFWELKGCYLPVGNDLNWLLKAVDTLRNNPDIYNDYSKKCIMKAEEYHIEKIGEMYKALDK
jgi:hypothetical protein